MCAFRRKALLSLPKGHAVLDRRVLVNRVRKRRRANKAAGTPFSAGHELQEVGVGLRLFASLMMLAKQDGINLREIGARLNFPEYFTSRNVDALVESDFAERRPDPESRRSFLVFLTESGKAKPEELPNIVNRVNDDVLQELTVDERKIVLPTSKIVEPKYLERALQSKAVCLQASQLLGLYW